MGQITLDRSVAMKLAVDASKEIERLIDEDKTSLAGNVASSIDTVTSQAKESDTIELDSIDAGNITMYGEIGSTEHSRAKETLIEEGIWSEE